MKKIIIWVIILTSLNIHSQRRKKKMDTLQYSKMISKAYSANFKNGMDISVYKCYNGNTFKAGDTLTLGIPSGINEVSQYGNRDTRFEYVFYGKPAGIFLKGIRYVQGRYRDYKLVIREIKFYRGSMGMENYVLMYTQPLEDKDFTTLDNYISVTKIDTALERQEIFPVRIDRPMTRDEAIAILKKYKEELDLGIITQKEYDQMKQELLPIIKSE